jgi:hypothetical protein
VELVLGQLQKKGEIKKIGSFRDARYMRIWFMIKILFICHGRVFLFAWDPCNYWTSGKPGREVEPLLGQLKIVIWLRTAGAGSTAVSCTGFYDWYITFGKSIF